MRVAILLGSLLWSSIALSDTVDREPFHLEAPAYAVLKEEEFFPVNIEEEIDFKSTTVTWYSFRRDADKTPSERAKRFAEYMGAADGPDGGTGGVGKLVDTIKSKSGASVQIYELRLRGDGNMARFNNQQRGYYLVADTKKVEKTDIYILCMHSYSLETLRAIAKTIRMKDVGTKK